VVRLRLKIETNTREHFTVRTTVKRPFAVESRWWQGAAEITTYEIEELLGTKLRALYQRKKGRDLFDLCVALEAGIDPAAIAEIFRAYATRGGHNITRASSRRTLPGRSISLHSPRTSRGSCRLELRSISRPAPSASSGS